MANSVKSDKIAKGEVLAIPQTARLRSRLYVLARNRTFAPVSVAGIVLFVYTACTLVMFRAGAVATDFAMVGQKFAHQSTASSVITFGPTFHYAPLVGYDGQFCYFIALDPQNARYYIDAPAYRYERILYPLVAHALALGQSAFIPYTLILVNILAISGGAFLLAFWLRRRGVSPWLALLYGLYSGLFIGYRRDLTEPLGYGLVILAIYCFDVWRQRAPWTGLVFGLAALAREATLLFAVVYVAALLFESHPQSWTGAETYLQRIRHNWRPAALMLALAVGPFLAYKVFLTLWLGTPGTPTSLFPSLIPFSGMILMLQPQRHTLVQLFLVCAPGLVCFALSLWALLRRRATVEIWALFANTAFFVVLLNPVWYEDSAPATTRIGIGIVLAALLAIPSFDALTKRDRRWLIACAPVWVSYTGLYLAMTALFVLTGVIVWPFLR